MNIGMWHFPQMSSQVAIGFKMVSVVIWIIWRYGYLQIMICLSTLAHDYPWWFPTSQVRASRFYRELPSSPLPPTPPPPLLSSSNAISRSHGALPDINHAPWGPGTAGLQPPDLSGHCRHRSGHHSAVSGNTGMSGQVTLLDTAEASQEEAKLPAAGWWPKIRGRNNQNPGWIFSLE